MRESAKCNGYYLQSFWIEAIKTTYITFCQARSGEYLLILVYNIGRGKPMN